MAKCSDSCPNCAVAPHSPGTSQHGHRNGIKPTICTPKRGSRGGSERRCRKAGGGPSEGPRCPQGPAAQGKAPRPQAAAENKSWVLWLSAASS